MAFDRSGVKGLPEGSNVQVIKEVPYVYFRYQWKDSTGKVKYARDYLGTVEDGQFVPNDYYLRLRPTKRKISAWLGYNSPTRGQASLIKGLRAASGES